MALMLALIAFLLAMGAVITGLFTEQFGWSLLLSGLAILIVGTNRVIRRRKEK